MLTQIGLRIMIDHRHDAVVIFCLHRDHGSHQGAPLLAGLHFLWWLCGEELLCLVRWWVPNQLLNTGS
jgi:hypothetical protein